METSGVFLKKGLLIEPGIQDIFNDISPVLREEIADIFTGIIFQRNDGRKFITRQDFLSNIYKINLILENLKKDRPEKAVFFDETKSYLSSLLHPKEKKEEFVKFELEKEVDINEFESQIKDVKVAEPIHIVKSYNIQPRKIEVNDFVKHFRNRFTALKNVLEERIMSDMISISRIGEERQRASIIGMVFDKRITKNKNIIFKIEDLTGRINVLVNKSKGELYQKAMDVVLDEVIGLKCSGNSEILFANEIIFPDLLARKIKTDYDEYALFIADLHIGSTNFLEDRFLSFIKWLNGEIGSEEQKETAKKVKYIFVVGDVIDGIGVHPLQEPLLLIKDVRAQYEKAAELFKKIRKDINVIMVPGNHDAMRIAEPQPQFNTDYAKSLYELENLYFVSNPAKVSIRGINILLYHGKSFDYYANNVDTLRAGNAYHNPRLIASFLLRKRHMAPTHTSTQYLPCEDEDPLMISQVPDVFVTAHIHRSDVSSYNNLLTISCSCFQSKTPLEEKMGHEPDPGKVPILHLKTGDIKIMDFG